MNLALVEDHSDTVECWHGKVGADPFLNWPQDQDGQPVNHDAVEDALDLGVQKENGWQASNTQKRRAFRFPTNLRVLGWVSPILLILALLTARTEAVPASARSQSMIRVFAPQRLGIEKTFLPSPVR